MAPNPVAPSAVNPCATPKGGGLGVVLAGRMARRSIPADLLAKFINASAQRLAQQSKERAPAKENAANASVSGPKPASIGAQELPNIYLLGSSQEQVVGKQIMRHLPAALLAKTQNLAGKQVCASWQRTCFQPEFAYYPRHGNYAFGSFFWSSGRSIFFPLLGAMKLGLMAWAIRFGKQYSHVCLAWKCALPI